MVGMFFMSTHEIAHANEQQNLNINDSKRLEKYVDEKIEKNMKKYPVPGVAISVVKDGKILFTKGYGYSDVEKKTPVDPESMPFRIGSITKTMTATAIMQLVEQGKVDVNEDINKYLKDIEIKGKDGNTITVHHLLTHTAGFDETLYYFVSGEKDISLREYVHKSLPKMIEKPGVDSSYNNYGYALLGLIIEDVTGQSYEEYMQKHIFDPLHMKNTTLTIPKNPVRSYAAKDGKFVEQQAKEINLRPAGSAFSTAPDMANYMMAHLQSGEYKNVLMNEETSKFMQKRHFTIHPRIAGFSYNFFEDMPRDQHQPIMHGGTLEGFRANLYLIPDEKLGIFISTNSDKGRLLFTDFFNQFHKDFYPQSYEHQLGPKVTKKSDLEDKIEGGYRSTRYVHHQEGKLIALLQQPMSKVNVIDDGKIELTLSGKKMIFLEEETNLFAEENGPDTIYFYKTPDGDTHFTLSSLTMMAYEKVSWSNHAIFKLSVFLILVLIPLLSVFLYPITGIVRKLRKQTINPLVTKFRKKSWLSNFLYTAYFLLILWFQELNYGSSDAPSLWLAIILPIAGFLLNVWLIRLHNALRREKLIGRGSSFVYAVLNIVGLIFIPNLIFWNLIGTFF